MTANPRISKAKQSSGPRSLPEYVSMVVSLGIVAGLVVTLVVLSVGAKGTAPKFVVETLNSRSVGEVFFLEVEVTNSGGRAARAIEVEGMVGGETSSAVIDLLAARSKTTITLVFSEDPADAELRVTGFREP